MKIKLVFTYQELSSVQQRDVIDQNWNKNYKNELYVISPLEDRYAVPLKFVIDSYFNKG